MALASLCAQLKRKDHWFKVADHLMSTPYAVIVNHGLREGSSAEAQNVADIVRKLGLKHHVMKVRWPNAGQDFNLNDLPNVETLARQLRYQRLGMFCKTCTLPSLLTAHHEDDQYETVLMRLLSGHGYRGLQGMRPATDIPECYNIHGVYQSGLIDDQRLESPLYNMRPTAPERSQIKRALRHEVDPAIIAREIEAGLGATPGYLEDEYDGVAKGNKGAPLLPPLEIEDGGVMVYRPLLHFSKDRLVATCVEAGIPWFEDHTNADQTLTLRNAVRHMTRSHRLPAALQKPAVLRLAERCRARVAAEEAEAGRLLDRALIHDFSTNAGTVMVTLPRLAFPTAPRASSRSPAGRAKRIRHYRHIAALLTRRLLPMVTPERELSQVTQLGPLVSMLFPALAQDSAPPPEPKPYVICGVHFIPVIGDHPIRWLLTRAPHVSHMPRPSATFHELPLAKRVHKHPSQWKAHTDMIDGQNYDGRYWVRIIHRLPGRIVIAPYEVEHQKAFREGLADEMTRKEFSAMLRRYAPGKVRYTLPAVYATIDVSDLLAGGDWWPADLALPRPEGEEVRESETVAEIRCQSLDTVLDRRRRWEMDLKQEGKLQLLALPTLGVALPGVDNWLQSDIRYRKLDSQLLRLSKLGGREVGRHELRHRARVTYRGARPQRRKDALLRRL